MGNLAIYKSSTDDSKRVVDKKDSDSYGTPDWLYDYLDSIYKFDLDVCASDFNHKCDKYFTIEDDSLSQDWSKHGKVAFCNPPFSRGMKEKFIEKAHEQMLKGVTTVFVIPSDFNNLYFRDLVFGKATKIMSFWGRISFNVPNTDIESKTGLGVAVVEFIPSLPHDDSIKWLDRDTIKALYK